jgi:hypothetical protein
VRHVARTREQEMWIYSFGEACGTHEGTVNVDTGFLVRHVACVGELEMWIWGFGEACGTYGGTGDVDIRFW